MLLILGIWFEVYFGTWFMVYHGCYGTFLRHIFGIWFEPYVGDLGHKFERCSWWYWHMIYVSGSRFVDDDADDHVSLSMTITLIGWWCCINISNNINDILIINDSNSDILIINDSDRLIINDRDKLSINENDSWLLVTMTCWLLVMVLVTGWVSIYI